MGDRKMFLLIQKVDLKGDTVIGRYATMEEAKKARHEQISRRIGCILDPWYLESVRNDYFIKEE